MFLTHKNNLCSSLSALWVIYRILENENFSAVKNWHLFNDNLTGIKQANKRRIINENR
jgi:hypothetical protein